MDDRFINFEIVFDAEVDPSGSRPVAAHVSPVDQRVRSDFTSPFDETELGRALECMERGRLGNEAATEFGRRLFEALFSADLRSVYDEHADAPGEVRYRLVMQSSEVSSLPWELMYDPVREHFLAEVSPLVRNVVEVTPSRPLQVEGGLRVLVVDSFPRGFAPLQSGTEAAAMRNALGRIRRRDDAAVDVLEHATRERLRGRLRRAANSDPPEPYHILHFIGHGESDPVSGATRLLFEDDAGDPDPVGADDLVDDLRDHDLSIVFLNACESLNTTAFETTGGFAPALLGAGVPAVVGMQMAVLDRVAVAFSREFYQALADGEPVDGALTAGRRVVGGGKAGREAHMGIPVIYLRTPTGQLFETPDRPRLAVDQLRPWIQYQLVPRRLAANLWKILGTVAVLVGLFLGGLELKERFFDPPPAMTGDFNVAVTGFGEFDESGVVVESDEGAALADSLYRELDETLATLELGDFDVQLRAPGDAGTLEGRSQADRAEAAARLAETIGADLVIYGTIDADDLGSRFEPEFYLSPVRLGADGEQLAGRYGLGSAIEVAGHVRLTAYRGELRSRLLDRSRALTHFVVGLTRYTQRRFEDAASQFQLAVDAEGWDPQDGKELAYVFLGNARGQLGDLEAAGAGYERALVLEPEYARAHLGRAEVTFLQAQGDCEANDVDVDGLVTAAGVLDAALAAEVQPETAEIPTRVSFGRGRIYQCLFAAGFTELHQGVIDESDLGAAAEREFTAVVSAFEEPRSRIREMVALAHAGLGLQRLLALGDDVAQSYRLAAESYERAEELTRDPQRHGLFLGFRGFITGRLDECDEALDLYARAIGLVGEGERRDAYIAERSGIEDRIAAGDC